MIFVPDVAIAMTRSATFTMPSIAPQVGKRLKIEPVEKSVTHVNDVRFPEMDDGITACVSIRCMEHFDGFAV